MTKYNLPRLLRHGALMKVEVTLAKSGAAVLLSHPAKAAFRQFECPLHDDRQHRRRLFYDRRRAFPIQP
ncbi:MAG: hypothetical protein EXR27_21505 [Betaproteobacteria bacterium]|nr:hypothetical protein [Betaproteobacteria bacterium]